MSDKYKLITDSSCDLPEEYLKKYGIISMPLTFSIDGKSFQSTDANYKDFYNKMREGALTQTSQVNSQKITEAFESVLKQEQDILHVAFSSGMSDTIENVRSVAAELRPKYPDQVISIVDSLSVSLGEGLLVWLAVQWQNMGMSLSSLTNWLEQKKNDLVELFMIDKLDYAHRGGRISKTVVVVGSLLGVKPIFTVNKEGEA